MTTESLHDKPMKSISAGLNDIVAVVQNHGR